MLATTLNYFTESPRKLRHLHHHTSFCIPTIKNVAINYPAKTLRLFVMNVSEGRSQSHVLPGFNECT